MAFIAFIVNAALVTVHLHRHFLSYRVDGVNATVNRSVSEDILTVNRQVLLVDGERLHQQGEK